MADWRIGRGWTRDELAHRLVAARRLGRSYDADEHDMTPDQGWSRYTSEAIVAREAPGSPMPGGLFQRAWRLVETYAFSDPSIVMGHFDPYRPLLGRHMLLELRVPGLRYLGAVVVGAVRVHRGERHTVRGFRYDTLHGHPERGWEWFLVSKDHVSGEVTFRVHAAWRPGDLPNAIFRWGFRLLARHYQRRWHRLAHRRLRAVLGSGPALGPVRFLRSVARVAPVARAGRVPALIVACGAGLAAAYKLWQLSRR